MRTVENLLGAVVLGLHDRLHVAVEDAAALRAEDPAALVTLHWESGISIVRLAAVLERSHAATVRIVDRLARDGLVKRRPGVDGRERRVHLTRAGERAALAVLAARATVLAAALSPLDERDRAALRDLLDRVAAGLTHDAREASTMCRWCDERECPELECPITLAVTT